MRIVSGGCEKMRGFSVLEMAIVIVVLGVTLAGAARVYSHYLSSKAIYETEASVDTITKALMAYKSRYKRYPCPAPRNDNTGVSSDCMDESVAPNNCGGNPNASYCVVTRTWNHDGNAGTPDITRRVRIGSVPFKTLSTGPDTDPYDGDFVGIGDTLDGYDNRFTYVVTEKQATGEFVENLGAILIQDEDGVQVHGGSDFLLISHGPDSRGARRINGQAAQACAGAGADLENCDLNDATFVDGLHVNQPGANYFDDRLSYKLWIFFYLWDQTITDPQSVRNLNAGNVGIGTKEPDERLHVLDGNARTFYHLRARAICDEDGLHCFSPDKIGSAAGTNVCPNLQAAVGIFGDGVTPSSAGQLECEPTIAGDFVFTCPPGQYITGQSYNSLTRTITYTCRDPYAAIPP